MATKGATHWGITAVAVFLCAAFILSGGMKLLGMEMPRESFEGWGYPLWFMYLTGVLEVAGAVLIVIPATRFWGAVLIVAIMIGALFTHLRAQEWVETTMPLIPLILAVIVAWSTRPGRPAGGANAEPTGV